MKGNSNILGSKRTISKTAASGVHDTFDQYNSRKLDTWPLTLSYNSLSLNSGTIYENTLSTITLNTVGIQSDTTLYWTILHGTTTSSDFYGGTVSGSFTQYSSTNQGSFYPVTNFTGNTSKTTKTFQIEIRTGSTSGPVVYTSGTFSIPAITVSSLYWSVNPASEGNYPTFYFQAGNCGTYTTYTVSLSNSGTITGADVSGGSLVTSFSANPGALSSFTYYVLPDLTTEGTETLTTQLSYGGYNIGSPLTLTVNDTSTTPTGTISPSTTNVTEGNQVTFTCTISGSYSGTAYYTINNVTGTMSTADFSDAALSGSFTVTSGSGSFAKTLVADGVAEGEEFSVSLRINSTSGTILATTATITVTDAAAPTGYTLTSGNRSTVLGASSASWPPVGWTSLQNASVDDSFVTVSLPFTFNFNGTGYTTVYVGSNFYITFGGGSSAYYGLTSSNPAYNKIMMNAADRSYQRVAYLSTSNYVRIRFEGGSSTSGTPGSSTVIYECTFFNPTQTSNLPTVEWIIGNSNATGGGISGIYSSSALLTSWTPASLTSFVFQAGQSGGTSWSVYTSYYMSGTGY